MSCIMMNVCVSLQYGYLLGKKEHMARAPASATLLPASRMEGCSKLTLNVRRLKLGTLNMIFRGPVTVSLWPFWILRLFSLQRLELLFVWSFCAQSVFV